MNETEKEVLELAERSISDFLLNPMVIELRKAETTCLTEIAIDFVTCIDNLEHILLLIRDRSKKDGRAKALPMPPGPCF